MRRELTKSEKMEMKYKLLDMMENDLPPLINVPIPRRVRHEAWFQQSGVEKFLKLIAFSGADIRVGNGKLPAAFKAWLMDEQDGKFANRPHVIGASSGNWATQSALCSSIFDVDGFSAVIEASVPKGKRDQIIAAGGKIIEAPKDIPGTDYVYELLDNHPGKYHLIDQYVHPGSVEGHQWSMDHIAYELNRMRLTPTLAGAVTGTCSTLMAMHRYLRPEYPTMKIFGVASASPKEKIPGSRSLETLDQLRKLTGSFRHEDATDFPLVTSVLQAEVYEIISDYYQMMQGSWGPTSALNIAGGLHLLRNHWERFGDFEDFQNDRGEIVMVLFFMDMNLLYFDDETFLNAFRR